MIRHLLTSLLCAASFTCLSQLQIDRPIELTGGSGQRSISNLEAPANPGDAANKAYVDANAGGMTHYAGEGFGGGVVAAVWMEGSQEKVLIVSPVDNATSVAWSNVTNEQIGASANSSWDGISNSAAIISQAGHVSSAALICDQYTGGGYTDWYLPAVDELTQLFNARFILNRVLGANPLTYDSNSRYWSSTEHNTTLAWDWNMQGGGGNFYGPQYSAGKSGSRKVRCVRKS